MLSDEVLDKVVKRVTRRIEQANTYTLEQIAKTIAKIGKLSPSNAYELGQMIKYGGDFDKIVKELARITDLNVKDIYVIFEDVARTDYEFAKQFYDYRNKKFIPYKDNIALQNEVEAIARETATTYLNISNSYAFKMLKNGRYVDTPLSTAFQEIVDKAILSVSQGESTFQEQMYSTIKELASSGLKTIEYGTSYIDKDGNIRNRVRRADSVVEMNLKDGLRKLHNRIEEITGDEFGADGVEISVHAMPADDHQDAQGRQFSKEQYDQLQKDGFATTYDGKEIDLHRELKSGELASSFRPISTMNCYHYIFAIVLGVSDPEYSDAELEKLKRDNEKGFELDGKHYTLYEGTQLQRNIELELRKAKDEQIMGRASGIMENVDKAQKRITALNRKYKELLDASGLRSQLERARVEGYRRIKVG